MTIPWVIEPNAQTFQNPPKILEKPLTSAWKQSYNNITVKTSRPQDLKTSRPQDLKTSRPQDLKTSSV
jgi:hypothetical protein